MRTGQGWGWQLYSLLLAAVGDCPLSPVVAHWTSRGWLEGLAGASELQPGLGGILAAGVGWYNESLYQVPSQWRRSF